MSPALPSLPSPSTRAEQERAGHRLSHWLPFASHASRAWSCHQLHASHASPEQEALSSTPAFPHVLPASSGQWTCEILPFSSTQPRSACKQRSGQAAGARARALLTPDKLASPAAPAQAVPPPVPLPAQLQLSRGDGDALPSPHTQPSAGSVSAQSGPERQHSGRDGCLCDTGDARLLWRLLLLLETRCRRRDRAEAQTGLFLYHLGYVSSLMCFSCGGEEQEPTHTPAQSGGSTQRAASYRQSCAGRQGDKGGDMKGTEPRTHPHQQRRARGAQMLSKSTSL